MRSIAYHQRKALHIIRRQAAWNHGNAVYGIATKWRMESAPCAAWHQPSGCMKLWHGINAKHCI
jgi:hypothetical protein